MVCDRFDATVQALVRNSPPVVRTHSSVVYDGQEE